MIEQLKNYLKTFEKFQKYMAGFNRQDINNLPDQFLIGCLLDFCAKNSKLILTISNGQNSISSLCSEDIDNFRYYYGHRAVFEKAFEMMETEK